MFTPGQRAVLTAPTVHTVGTAPVPKQAKVWRRNESERMAAGISIPIVGMNDNQAAGLSGIWRGEEASH